MKSAVLRTTIGDSKTIVKIDGSVVYVNNQNMGGNTYVNVAPGVAQTDTVIMSQLVSHIFVGCIVPLASSIPISTGFLPCEGGAYSTITYSDLFSVIGYTFGSSGSNFRVPDYRGYFLSHHGTRGLNSSIQDNFQSHNHNVSAMNISGNHTHSIDVPPGTFGAQHGREPGYSTATTHSNGGGGFDWSHSGEHSHGGGYTYYNGNTQETRPTNLAVRFYIKW